MAAAVHRYLVIAHGVGSSVVNALSTQLDIRVHKNGKIHYQEYRRGHVVADLEVIGDTDQNRNNRSLYSRPRNFTETTTFDFDKLNKRIPKFDLLESWPSNLYRIDKH